MKVNTKMEYENPLQKEVFSKGRTMRMTYLIFSCLIVAGLLISPFSKAQVEVTQTKSTITGKSSFILESIPESMLDHFNINFYTYFFGSDQGGNNAKGNLNTVSVEAELAGLDNELAQAITDEAYAYFVQKWKERGINVTCPSEAEIEASKYFSKDKSKGKAEIVKPGIYQEGNQFAKYVRVLPTGTSQVKKDYYGNMVYGNAAFFPGDYTGNLSRVNFHFDLNFIEFKAGFGTNASIKGTPGLKSTAGGSLSLMMKAKPLAIAYSNEGTGGADFYDSFDDSSKWIITINKDKYKVLALEMIKKSIDSQMAEYDANVAKEK